MSLSLSRSGHTSPLGKLTAELPKIRVPEDTKDGLDRAARNAGMSTSEYLRELVMLHVHGHEYVASLYAHRLALVAGAGKESGGQG